jgi:perosamine synthetase
MINLSAPDIGEEEISEVRRIMLSGNLAQGPEVAAFESEFASLHTNTHAIATNAGTSALHISLLALGIGPGDEVIVPSFTFAATANAVKLTGATPVFADIESEYFCLDPQDVIARLTHKTKAIIPVHLYGQISNMTALNEVAKKHGLILVEDTAQAHFAELNGVRAGLWGDAAAFSFYPTKNMTSGEGGMVLTNSDTTERLCRLYRNQGMLLRYQNEVVGFNYRMTDIHAAIGRVQLRKLESYTSKRIANSDYLNSNLKNVQVPAIRQNSRHVFHQYTIIVPEGDRDSFAEELSKRGVASGIYYPTPVDKLKPFDQVHELKVTDFVSKNCLSIPVHPKLTEFELEKIVAEVNSIAAAGA